MRAPGETYYFGDVDELGGIAECTPEWCDEEEDEEDRCVLSGRVVALKIRRLQRGLADQGDKNAGKTDQQECPSAELLYEEGAEDVAGESRGDPE